MKRPLLYILGFYILGIMIGQYSVDKAFIVLFFVCAIAYTAFLYKKYSWGWVFIFPFFTVLGGALLILNALPVDSTVENMAKNNEAVTIVGKVIESDYTSNGRPKIILKTDTIETENTSIKKELKIQVIMDKEDKVYYNQNIRLSGNLECFDFKRNPGAFNETLYMKTRKIDYKMFAKLIKSGAIEKPSYIYTLHEKLKKVYDTILPQKEASTLKLMLLGDHKALDVSIKELYRKSGISHILAISGTHIAILSFILFMCLKYIGLNNRINSGMVLVLLIFYCIFTGNNVSAIRAVFMIGIVLLGNIIYRQHDSYTTIATAALVLLIHQPLYLFDVGFQLSFSAVIGIILLTPLLCRIYIIPEKIRSYVAATLAATVFTYPIVAFHFYTVSIIGVLVNILILPFVSIVVGFGLLAGVIGLMSIEISKFICGIVYVILKGYEFIGIHATKLPFAVAVIGQPNIMLIFIYYSMVFLIIVYYYTVYEKRIKIRKQIVRAQLSLIVVAVFIIVKPKNLEIVYLDVGQGDCIAIHTADNKNILIDGGGIINKGIGEANTGTMKVLPYLNYKGINSIDAVFVTHPDGDHILGIIEIIGLVDIKQIVVSDVYNMTDNALFLNLRDKAYKYSIPIVEMGRGDKINLKEVYFECLYPYKGMVVGEDDWNSASLVLYMKHGNNTFIFTGDIEKEAEYDMIKAYENLESDVLKIPHHGSKTSSTKAFVNSVSPVVGIISAGKDNSYGHPHYEVVDGYQKMNTRLYNTAYDGAIILHSDGKSITRVTMKEVEKR